MWNCLLRLQAWLYCAETLADCKCGGSSLLIALETLSILVGIRKNTVEAVENAITKVVRSLSIAIPGLSDFSWFATEAPSALQQKSIRAAVSKELARLDLMAGEWKTRPFFVSALRSFAGISSSISPEQSETECTVSVMSGPQYYAKVAEKNLRVEPPFPI